MGEGWDLGSARGEPSVVGQGENGGRAPSEGLQGTVMVRVC